MNMMRKAYVDRNRLNCSEIQAELLNKKEETTQHIVSYIILPYFHDLRSKRDREIKSQKSYIWGKFTFVFL